MTGGHDQRSAEHTWYRYIAQERPIATRRLPHYWVVDPDVPNVTAWKLHEGVYVESGFATGDEQLMVGEPFELTVRPSALISR